MKRCCVLLGIGLYWTKPEVSVGGVDRVEGADHSAGGGRCAGLRGNRPLCGRTGGRQPGGSDWPRGSGHPNHQGVCPGRYDPGPGTPCGQRQRFGVAPVAPAAEPAPGALHPGCHQQLQFHHLRLGPPAGGGLHPLQAPGGLLPQGLGGLSAHDAARAAAGERPGRDRGQPGPGEPGSAQQADAPQDLRPVGSDRHQPQGGGLSLPGRQHPAHPPGAGAKLLPGDWGAVWQDGVQRGAGDAKRHCKGLAHHAH